MTRYLKVCRSTAAALALLASAMAVSPSLADPIGGGHANIKSMSFNAESVNTTLHVISTDGQKWNMTVGPDACEVGQGKLDGADVFLKTSEDKFLDLLAGKWKPGVMDFMRGKIKSNDPTKLTVLKDCFL